MQRDIQYYIDIATETLEDWHETNKPTDAASMKLQTQALPGECVPFDIKTLLEIVKGTPRLLTAETEISEPGLLNIGEVIYSIVINEVEQALSARSIQLLTLQDEDED